MNRRILAMVLAGGKGTRLYPLTRDRAKPAVPFGGKYRIVDFVLSNLIHRANVYAYDFRSNNIPEDPPSVLPYWRDVGTVDAFYEANMDLRTVTPALNLYNAQWPLGPTREMHPPAKFVFDQEGRRGHAIDSIVSSGCIISGGLVRDSVLGRAVRVHSGAIVERSVLFDNCDIGRNARVQNAILDKNAKVPENAMIGYDLESDRQRYHVSENGIVVVEGDRSAVEVTVYHLTPPQDHSRRKTDTAAQIMNHS